MKLRLNHGEKYILNGVTPALVFTDKHPEHDVPDALVERLGLLDERVPTFDREGAMKGEVARFVRVDGPTKAKGKGE